MIHHTVYFWFNEGSTEEDHQRMQTALGALCEIDLIDRVAFGRPAATAERPVTDHSFDWALHLDFTNQANHDAYQIHADHDVFIDACKDLWAKVLVYDTESAV